MVKNLDNAGKFLMYPRFVQVFLEKQLEGMKSHNRIYVTRPSLTLRRLETVRRVRKGFSRRTTQPKSLLPTRKQRSRRPKRKDIEVPQPSGPTTNVADKAVYKERGDSLERAATTATGLDAKQDRASSDEASLGDQDDASKQGRKIDDIDKDAKITLVDETHGRYGYDIMFDVSDLAGEEVFVAEQGVPIQAPTPIISSQQPSQAKIQDKGKAKMIEPEPVKKLSKKDQLNLDKEVAQRLKAEFDGQERIEREKAEANIALKETWDDIQAKIKAEKRRKHFAAKRAEEKRNIPTTKAQQRSIMCTYLKIMEGWKPKDLKNKSFNSIQKLFDKAMKRIAQESSSKRVGDELEQKSIKNQKVDEDKETAELKSLIEVIPDEEEVAVDAIPLATKPSSIVDYKIHKEGKKTYYQIIRADGSSKMYLVFSHMLKSFDREDLETLWKLVKAKHGSTRPEEGYERML
ncbi:hypothetical protein Tco_1410910 [Tanacetum coccineum]